MVNKKIKALTILDIKKIKRGEFANQIPEFYELKSVIENNDWHKNDSVFSHTLTVLGWLEKILKKTKRDILNHLSEKIDYCTRKELLMLAALFHDIAKKETIIKKGNKTSCLCHEEKGSIKVRKILSRFNLSKREKVLVSRIINNHDLIHLILKLDSNEREKAFARFKKSNVFWETALLGAADTLGCQPKKEAISEVGYRLKFYKKLLFNS